MADKAPTVSFLEVLRQNRVGALLSGVIVMIAVALVLSAAVPDDINTPIAILLILLLALAVGYTVRVTSPKQDGVSLFTAGALAAIGVPLMLIAGGATVFGGYAGAAFDDSILATLNYGFLSIGSAIAAIAAIIVAGWGTRSK